jgi:hypothetical protein
MADGNRPGPLTSLMGANGKVPDSKFSFNKFIPGPEGIMLIIIAIIVVILAVLTFLGVKTR